MMDIFSILIGYIIVVLLSFATIMYVLWRMEVDDDRKKKKWSDADFDRIFHDAWNAGFEYGKVVQGKEDAATIKKYKGLLTDKYSGFYHDDELMEIMEE